MKKSIFLVLISILLVISSITCSAKSADATLAVDYEYVSEDNVIKVDASFVDIKAQEGIVTIEYEINYDASALELVSFATYFPKDWEPLLVKKMFEDFTQRTENGKIRWVFVLIAVGKGAKNDNELGIKLEFKPLNEAKTNVEFKYLDIGTEILKNGITESLERVSGNSVNLSIDLANPSTPEIDDTSITVPENSSKPNNTESQAQISQGGESGGAVSMPIVQNSEGNLGDNEDDNASNWILWVIIAVGVVGAGAVVAIVLKSKKG